MYGQKGGPPYWDNYRREPMDWYAAESGLGQTTWFRPDDRWNQPDDGVSVEEQENDTASLLNFYRRVLALRAQHTALKAGNFESLVIDASGVGPWGFLRRAQDETILVVYNFSAESRQVILPDLPFAAENCVELLSDAACPLTSQAGGYQLRLPPASIFWLAAAEAASN